MNQTISRREALGMIAQTGMSAMAVSLLAQWTLGAEPEKRPNVLYIMADDHAPHALSCYGSVLNSTPNMDRIAKEGVRFERCFVTNSLCGPSRACLLTGKYSHMNGFCTNTREVFNGAQPTFPKMLRAAGYQTAVIGKWHLESDPTGFDHWSILVGQGVYNNPVFIENGKRKKVDGYVTDVITDMSLEWLDKRDKTKPFCLLCHHKAPHRSWVPDEKHATMYEKDLPTPKTFNDDYSTRGRAAHEQEMSMKDLTKTDTKADPPAGLSEQQVKEWKYQRFIKDYLRVIASVDDNIGRMLEWLDKNNLTENTIVIYTSDNGFFLGDHGWFDKRFMYEESLRVPFVVRYPGKIKPGTVSKAIVSNLDFAPTFLDFAGAPIPADMQGKSIRGVLEGREEGIRKAFYYHYYEFPAPHRVQPHAGVRSDRYKLIHFYVINEWELYDLEKDSIEIKNVWNDPAYADVQKQMVAEYERCKAEYKDNDFTPRQGAGLPQKAPAK